MSTARASIGSTTGRNTRSLPLDSVRVVSCLRRPVTGSDVASCTAVAASGSANPRQGLVRVGGVDVFHGGVRVEPEQAHEMDGVGRLAGFVEDTVGPHLTRLQADPFERGAQGGVAQTRACRVCPPQRHKLLVYLKADPKEVDLVPGFTRDVSRLGHHGTGDLEVQLRTPRDVERAQDLFRASYAAA